MTALAPQAAATDVLVAQVFLVQALVDTGPASAIACAAACFDPLRAAAQESEEFTDSGDEVDYLLAAWRICRTCFPAVYARVNRMAQEGAGAEALGRFICHSIADDLNLPIGDLEELVYGIPFEWYGVSLYEEESWPTDAYPLFQEVLDALGDDLQDAANTASILGESLIQTGQAVYEEIDTLLNWMFSSTGNSLCDLCYEEAAESGMNLPWEPGEVAWAKEAVAEARRIMDTVGRAFKTLETNAAIWTAFQKNAARTRKHLDDINQHGGIPRDDDARNRLLHRLAAGCRWP